jgi:SAM-dependent methyltransferase
VPRNVGRIVAEGYDSIAERYAAWNIEGNPAERFLRDLDASLPEGASVLELGCGNGTPGAVVLARRHRYTGVDISREQLERARRRVPGVRFLHADYTFLEVEQDSLDAVAAILTLTHVPRDEHGGLFRRIGEWLRPGGWFLASLGTSDAPDCVEQDWLGAPMFFSHFDADTNRTLLQKGGFRLARDEIVAMHEEGYGETRFLWVLAQKPG